MKIPYLDEKIHTLKRVDIIGLFAHLKKQCLNGHFSFDAILNLAETFWQQTDDDHAEIIKTQQELINLQQLLILAHEKQKIVLKSKLVMLRENIADEKK